MSRIDFVKTQLNRMVRNGLTPAMITLLLASTALNVVQAKRLGLFAAAPTVHPEPGTPAHPILGKTLDGRPAEITFGEEPTILYYFSPQCTWCEANWLNIKALQAGTEGKYRFIGLSTTPDIKSFMQNHGLSFEVYSNLTPETLSAFSFGGTPHTVVVGEDGRVQYTWMGAYNRRQQPVVERAFDIILPGLPKPEAHTR